MTEIDYKKLTATKSTWDFKVQDMDFVCEELTLDDEVELFNYYIDPDGKTNVAKMRMVQTAKIIKSPFTPEWIKHVFTTFYPEIKLPEDVSWDNFDIRHRILFLSKLNSDFMSKVMQTVAKHYTEKEKTVKN